MPASFLLGGAHRFAVCYRVPGKLMAIYATAQVVRVIIRRWVQKETQQAGINAGLITLLLAGLIGLVGLQFPRATKAVRQRCRTEAEANDEFAFDHTIVLMVTTPWQFYRTRENRPVANVSVKAGRVD